MAGAALMPVGHGLAGPIAAAVGAQATLLGMSALGVLGALVFLAVPEVRACRAAAIRS